MVTAHQPRVFLPICEVSFDLDSWCAARESNPQTAETSSVPKRWSKLLVAAVIKSAVIVADVGGLDGMCPTIRHAAGILGAAR